MLGRVVQATRHIVLAREVPDLVREGDGLHAEEADDHQER
jgi:hypothetical protein